MLLLAGWIGLTVAGSLLHLLAILSRIRHFTLAMPRPRPARDRLLTTAAAGAIVLLATSKATSLTVVRIPATGLTLAVATALSSRLIALAARAVARQRTSRAEPNAQPNR